MIIIRSVTLAFFCAGLLLSTSNVALAGTDNDIPSCYTTNKIKHYLPIYDKLVYVLIDQTLPLDKTLQNSVLRNLAKVLEPGTKFVVAEFSAFAQGRYLHVINTGVIENPIPDDHIGDVVMTRLQSFQACLKNQILFAQRIAVGAAYSTLSNSSGRLNHSDILMALKMVAASVLHDSAREKLVFLVTDGLENSSITSFYANRTLRLLDINEEMVKVKKNKLLSDFGGARVYVLGGADLPAADHGTRSQRDGYRNPTTLLALEQFWRRYFSHSNAKLVEFGEPALMIPISFR